MRCNLICLHYEILKAVIVFWWLDWLHKACLEYMHKLHILMLMYEIDYYLLGKNVCFNFDKFLTVLYEIEGAGGTLLSYVFKFVFYRTRYFL